jgi:hypothetical protein
VRFPDFVVSRVPRCTSSDLLPLLFDAGCRTGGAPTNRVPTTYRIFIIRLLRRLGTRWTITNSLIPLGVARVMYPKELMSLNRVKPARGTIPQMYVSAAYVNHGCTTTTRWVPSHHHPIAHIRIQVDTSLKPYRVRAQPISQSLDPHGTVAAPTSRRNSSRDTQVSVQIAHQ